MKKILSMVNFLENMWDEYGEIKHSRRAVAIVFESHIHFLVNELLRVSGEKDSMGGYSLKPKAELLKILEVIPEELCSDMITISEIRDRYAHSILYDKTEADQFFTSKVNSLKALNKMLMLKDYFEGKKKTEEPLIDFKFGKSCYYILSKIGDAYYKKID